MQKTEQQLAFNGVKIFSATMAKDRELLGDRVTTWLREKQAAGPIKVTDYIVTQSSDNEFHCISISVFFVDGEQASRAKPAIPEPPITKATTKGAAPRRLNFSEK